MIMAILLPSCDLQISFSACLLLSKGGSLRRRLVRAFARARCLLGGGQSDPCRKPAVYLHRSSNLQNTENEQEDERHVPAYDVDVNCFGMPVARSDLAYRQRRRPASRQHA